MPKPKWITSTRELYLAKVALDYLDNLVGWQLDVETGELHHSGLDAKLSSIIANWVSDDRELRQLEWELERKALHRVTDRQYPISGQFNAVSRDIYHDSQPLYYIEGYGLSGITSRPFVKVRLSSTYMRLHINLGDTLKRLSKNKRRKVVRYDKGGLPKEVEAKVKALITEAVRDYRR
jgi:hypothetical protein